MLCAYNCYRKRAGVRDTLGSVKCVDFEVVFAIAIIVAVIIFTTEQFIYGFIGLVVFLLGDILWFIIWDIETVEGGDRPRSVAEPPMVGVACAQTQV